MFQGRSVQGVENRAFGGINELANIINLKQGFALDMLDFEIDPTLAVRRRDGMTLLSNLGTSLRYAGTYYDPYGVQVFVAVCDNKFWEATSPNGPWTDRTNGVTLSSVDGPWIGADLGGKFLLANGVDQPIVHRLGLGVQTVKDASQILPPQGLAISCPTPGSVTTYLYVVTAITARGETTPSAIASVLNDALSGSNPNTIQWNLRAGAQGYIIYKYDSGIRTYLAFGSVSGLTNQYVDAGQANSGLGSPPIVNTAWNTPTKWEGIPPSGFVVVARGRSQRMLAFSNGYFWASSLSDPLNWLQPNDAFDQPIYGGKDSNITAGATLYDYTVLCSKTNTFVYEGSTYQDFNLVKILSVGCVSPHSIVTAGDQLFFWSEVGPNAFNRVMAGQDIQTTPDINGQVQNTVSSLSNRSKWSKIVAWNHIRNNRIGWAYPNGSSTTNNRAIMFAYSGRADWSRHSTPPIVNAFTDTQRIVYVATADGNIYQLYSGNTDNGSTITGTYETGWYDSQSFLNRYIVFLDVICDKSVGAYNLNVEIRFDFASTGDTHALTDTTTDGIPVVIQTPLANIHRLYVRGIGRYFKFIFSVTSSPNAPRILGWRPEMYSKGIR